MKKTIALALTMGLCATLMAPSFADKMGSAAGGRNTTAMQTGTTMAPEFRLIKTLKGEDSFSIMRPTFSRDGKFVAANLNESKSVRIWDTTTGEVIGEISADKLFGNAQTVDGLEFTPNGSHIVVFRAGFPLKEIAWRTGEIVRSFDLGVQGNKIEDYAFTPDFRWMAFATPNGIDLWDFNKGQRVSRMMEGQYVNSLDISRDGRWMAFGKRGAVEQSVGVIDLNTKTVSKYPLANLTEEQREQLPNYQVRHVSFEGNNHLLVGYMALPEGQFRPTGPAGVFMVNLQDGKFNGPTTLSSNMLSFDPVMLRQPFNATFVNTFEMGTDHTASAADFLAPNLNRIKTITDAELNGPMMTFRVSPDQKWMAGSFKEPDGKVRLRLYEITPERSNEMRMN